MSQLYPSHGTARDPASAGPDRLIDAWMRRELSDAYDRTLGETLPEELLVLVMSARSHRR
jgi:hypothetical protein